MRASTIVINLISTCGGSPSQSSYQKINSNKFPLRKSPTKCFESFQPARKENGKNVREL
jgi:hypothetical protein